MYFRVITIGKKKKKKKKVAVEVPYSVSTPINVARNTEISGVDIIRTDVPLIIRLLEFAKSEAQTDEDLHFVAKNLVELSNSEYGPLTMDHYRKIVTM